jgi:tRNA G46 methylase TrmB
MLTPNSRMEMLDIIGIEGKVCAEIGVAHGDYSAEILKRNPSKLVLVDPWHRFTADPNTVKYLRN